MKKKFLLLMASLAFVAAQAQVGINTDNPLTDLHVVGNQYTTGITKIGGNLIFKPSAQLELGDTDKGFLPNRVALVDSKNKAPLSAVYPGMLVYNTTVNASLGEGLHFWTGVRWEAFVTEVPPNPVTGFDLTIAATSLPTPPSTTENGVYLNLGDLTDGSGRKYFTIHSPGSYAFAIRVYGDAYVMPGKTAGRACVYFTLMVNGVKTDVQEVNWALVDVVASTANNKIGGTIMLTGPNLKEGDKIQFTLAHYNVPWSQPVVMTANSGLNANKSSLVFWRL